MFSFDFSAFEYMVCNNVHFERRLLNVFLKKLKGPEMAKAEMNAFLVRIGVCTFESTLYWDTNVYR